MKIVSLVQYGKITKCRNHCIGKSDYGPLLDCTKCAVTRDPLLVAYTTYIRNIFTCWKSFIIALLKTKIIHTQTCATE